MRKYDSIWIALKKEGHCAVAVHPSLHARVIKAVINTKDRDIGFKLTQQQNAVSIKINYKREGARIRFFLIRVYHLSRVKCGDL